MTETTTEQPLTPIPPEAAAILASYDQAQTLANKGKEFASQAVKAALKTGSMLLTQKAFIGHGKWMKWRSLHLPEISDDNAKRWMKLAKSADTRQLTEAVAEAPNLRQAYKAVLLPPAVKPKTAKPVKARANVIDVLNKVRGHKLLAPLLVEDGELELVMNPQLLRAALEPLAKLYGRLE